MKKDNQNISIYESHDGQISFNVNVFEESVWLTQKQMTQLFDKSQRTISEHINNIYAEGELDKNSTYRNFRLVQKEANRMVERNVEHYNLDLIISVGYRVKSPRGTQFRIWATKILKQYLLNGYSVNEKRIRQIEDSIDELVASNKLIREDVNGIKNLLIKLIERPIVIHNHNHNKFVLTSDKLEEKIIELLDQIIDKSEDEKVKNQLLKVQEDLKASPRNAKTKNKITKFFTDLGDDKSTLHKTIKGIGISKKIISELIRLGEKLRDLIN